MSAAAQHFKDWLNRTDQAKTITIQALSYGSDAGYGNPQRSWANPGTIVKALVDEPFNVTQIQLPEGVLPEVQYIVRVAYDVAVNELDHVVINSVTFEVGPVSALPVYKMFQARRIIQ